MAMVEVDIPKKSQRMLTRHASESNFQSDLDEPIFIQPIKEKPCFALSVLIPKSPEERRKIHQKHLDEKFDRSSKIKVISDNSDSPKKEKESLKDSSQLTIMHLRENLRKLRYDQSLIHQWGVYTTEPIRKNEAIIEYIGELIRLRVADKRQIKYEAEGNNGSYIFQLEKDKLIDATHKGGLARFINHSCTPNCATQVKRFDGQNHIIIYAKRDIHPYEELCYDYQMEYEPKEKRIRCLCGSPNCKQWLNWSEKAEIELNYKWSNGVEHKRRFQSAVDDDEAESNESIEMSETNRSNESNESNQNDQPDESDKTTLFKEKEILNDLHINAEDDSSDEKYEQDEFDIDSFKKQQKNKGSRKSNKVNKSNKPGKSYSQNDNYNQIYNRKSISTRSVTRHVIQKEENQQKNPVCVKQEFPVNAKPGLPNVKIEPPVDVKPEISKIKQKFQVNIEQGQPMYQFLPQCFNNQHLNTGNLRTAIYCGPVNDIQPLSAPSTPLKQNLIPYHQLLPTKIAQNQSPNPINSANEISSCETLQQQTNQQINPQNSNSCNQLSNKEEVKQLEKPQKK